MTLPGRSTETAKILIVDDDASALRLLERVLRGAGYSRLRCTQDAREVLALYEDLQPDLILLDLHLSPIGGLELLTQLVSRTRGAYVPVLMLTADHSTTAVHEALAAGAKDFVRKPFDTREVLLRIRTLVETRFLHRALEEQTQAVTQAAAEAVSGVMADLIARPDVGVAAERVAGSVRTLLQTRSAGVYRIEAHTGDLVALAIVGTLSRSGPTGRLHVARGSRGARCRPAARPCPGISSTTRPSRFRPRRARACATRRYARPWRCP
jgi:CheY-like chemotaxis protein